jgi:competence protein ComEC
MTGLSPSVNRAICMFTLIIVSGLLKRNVSAFNHIGSAAFLLVLIDPHAIFDLGFLLSFSAVLGIIGAKPILDRLSRIKNKVLRLICVPIVISIVAQLATFPITLFSFGTFPLWFLPANFIAVPLSTLLTYIGLSSLVLADIPFIGEGMMHVFSWGIKVLNEWAWFIGQLPYSQLKGLTISMIEFVFISISIYFLFRSFHIQSKRSLLFFCHFLFLTCLTTFMRIEWEASSRKIQLFAFKNQLHIRISKNFNSSHFIIASSAQPIKPIYFPFLQKDEKCDVQFILVGNSRLHSSTTRGIHNSSYHFISKNVCLVFNNLSDNEWKEIERHSQLQLHFIPAPWMYSTEMKAVKKKCKMKDIRCLDLEKQGCINLSY